mmetsp:Transcript_95730/g.310163  ORF Transcript_95730/g.310163 Transcript_95730/m.310163 type:complete len:126 (-) Transcript_95730:193-570(-)
MFVRPLFCLWLSQEGVRRRWPLVLHLLVFVTPWALSESLFMMRLLRLVQLPCGILLFAMLSELLGWEDFPKPLRRRRSFAWTLQIMSTPRTISSRRNPIAIWLLEQSCVVCMGKSLVISVYSIAR